jgi:hypothetical protein
MSNYINVLRRLERERRMPDAPPPAPTMPSEVETRLHIAPVVPPAEPTASFTPTSIAPEPVAVATPPTVIPLPSVTPAPPPPSPQPLSSVRRPEPVAADPVGRQLDTRRSRAFATEAHPGIATLLDNIRMLSSGRARRVVVFCGASNAEAVTALAGDLATHAERSGMSSFVGTLTRTSGGSVVTPALGSSIDAAPLEVDLDAGAPTAELDGWVERVAPGSDLIVITGPPLAMSIDAALLACACDGLVIVAESEVTERAALQVAAERARIAGCRTLGVVMHGTKDRLPGWIRRLMGDRSETPPHERTS